MVEVKNKFAPIHAEAPRQNTYTALFIVDPQ